MRLLITLFLWTLFVQAYAQKPDSVTISMSMADSIEADLQRLDLFKSLDSAHEQEIDTLNKVVKIQTDIIATQSKQIETMDAIGGHYETIIKDDAKEIATFKRRSKWQKVGMIAVGSFGLIVGVLIGKGL